MAQTMTSLNFHSSEDSDEEDDRSEEIKDVIANHLHELTFEEDSENSFHTKDHGGQVNGNGGERLIPNGNGIGNDESVEYPGLPNPYFNEFRNRGGGDFDIPVVNLEMSKVSSKRDSGNSMITNNINGNMNNSKRVRFEPAANGRYNGNQSADRDEEEIIATNPTISLMHQRHCPQTYPNGKGDWNEDERQQLENLTSVLELRDKRISKLEEEAESFAKERRTLNHQLGMLRTEMVQMKSTHDDLEKLISLRDEEIKYLKTQIGSAVENHDAMTQREQQIREEANAIAEENAKLKMQIQQLTSIGNLTQQTEVDTVVRQIRERHSKGIAHWQTKYADIESELQIYKRNHDHLLEKIRKPETNESYTQTEPQPVVVKQRIVPIMFDSAAQTLHRNTISSFTQTNDQQPIIASATPMVTKSCETCSLTQKSKSNHSPSKSIDGNITTEILEQWKEAYARSEADRERLVSMYEDEIQNYKTKLALLPSELFQVWKKQQEELGVVRRGSGSPVAAPLKVPVRVDTAVQTQCDVMDAPSPSHDVSSSSLYEALLAVPNTRLSTSDNKPEVSSVVVQTEDTLHTFDELGKVMQEWAAEVLASGQRADAAEANAARAVEAANYTHKQLEALQKQFNELATGVSRYHKQTKQKEEALKKQLVDQKEKFVAAMNRVLSKLNHIPEIEALLKSPTTVS